MFTDKITRSIESINSGNTSIITIKSNIHYNLIDGMFIFLMTKDAKYIKMESLMLLELI